jgi:hypothetical protein
MITGDLDLAKIRIERLNNRMLHQRRPEIYGTITSEWKPWQRYPDLKPFTYPADAPAN